VVFITGLCPRDCFYCPLSREKKGKDIILANERQVDRLIEIASECLSSGSRGVGLTGGDPMMRLERSIDTIKLLKDFFGDSFHVHMYTTGLTLKPEYISRLERAGLDELRLHPPNVFIPRLLSRLSKIDTNIDIGFELPVFPDKAEETLSIIRLLDEYATISFVNLNELEFSDSNSLSLKKKGYSLSRDWKTAKGSREAGEYILRVVEEEKPELSIHFCPASAKDRYQTGLRYYRRGILTAKPHELVSDEGLLLKALVSETCVNVPSLMEFRGAYGKETHLVLAETLGLEYRVIEETPEYRRVLLNIT